MMTRTRTGVRHRTAATLAALALAGGLPLLGASEGQAADAQLLNPPPTELNAWTKLSRDDEVSTRCRHSVNQVVKSAIGARSVIRLFGIASGSA